MDVLAQSESVFCAGQRSHGSRGNPDERVPTLQEAALAPDASGQRLRFPYRAPGLHPRDAAGNCKSSVPTGGRDMVRELNERLQYTMWSVFRIASRGTLDEVRAGAPPANGTAEGAGPSDILGSELAELLD